MSLINISPSKTALQMLKYGNNRFIKNLLSKKNYHLQLKNTSKVQEPFAVILSCIDSRVPTEIIFDLGIGDLFNIKIAGNIVNKDILGSLEFACKISGAKLIVVLGHTDCGAIKGACNGDKLGNLSNLLKKLENAVSAVKSDEHSNCKAEDSELFEKIALKNVRLSIEEIKNRSEILIDMLSNNEIDIVGAMYNVTNGKVSFFPN